MKTEHLDADQLRAILRGELDDPGALRTMALHLLDGCEECREAWTRWEATGGSSATGGGDYEQPLESVLGGVCGRVKKRVIGAAEAEARARELLALPVAERAERLEADPERYLDPGVAHLLLDLGRRGGSMTSERAESLATLARSIVDRLAAEGRLSARMHSDFKARIEAHLANAERLRGDYRTADLHFDRVYRRLDEGTGDPLTMAEVLVLEGSLLRDQRHFADAAGTLRRAASLYQNLGDEHRAGRCRIVLAAVERDAGHPSRAVEILRSSLELLDFALEPQLELAVHTNLALYTAEAGDPEAALELLARYPIDSLPTERLRLHGLWTHGLILGELGRYAEQSEVLSTVYARFAELGEAHNTALAALDLALAFAHQGETAAVQRLAHDALRLLEPLNVPRDTFASLLLFQRAAHTQRATVKWIEELKTNLADPRRWRTAG